MSNLTMKDLDYEKIIENYNKVEDLEKILDEVIDKLNKLIRFKKNIESIIDERIKLYIENKESNNSSIEKSQIGLVEPKKIKNNEVEKSEEVKENKLDISKFIEAFSKEFNFINKDEFNEEMENNEIMGKIIELIKRMLGIKNDEINEKKKEIAKLNTKKDELENNIKTLNSNITEKEKKNNILENKKVELEGELENLNNKVNELETSKNNLEKDIRKLNNTKNEIESNLSIEKGNVTRLEGIERTLTAEKTKLEKEKKELEEKDKENSEKMKIFMKKYEEKEKELESIGDLLQAKKLYDRYLSMETRILSKLDNVLIQRDFDSFISSGYTLSSLDNVWDIVKIEYKNISKEDKEILKEVFSFFLNQINKRFKEAKYGLVQVEVGEGFDAVNQVDLSQNSRGIVTECVFYGYGFLKEKENPDDEDVITRIIKSPLVLTA